ncbi:MAG TPA: SsgA family sporulation/cell division regulator [Marmoricola sp.]
MDPCTESATPTARIMTTCEGVLIDEDGNEISVPCALGYDPGDPYAISFTLHGAQREVTWVFARTLIADGVFEPTGEADVHVWPTVSARGHARVAIELANAGVTALVLVPSCVTLGFLDRTEALMPFGTESAAIDLDATVDALLGSSLDGLESPDQRGSTLS